MGLADNHILRDVNLFFVGFVVAAGILGLVAMPRFRKWVEGRVHMMGGGHHGRVLPGGGRSAPSTTFRKVWIVIGGIALGSTVVLGICAGLFEMYYMSYCPVNQTYYDTNLKLARTMMSRLNEAQIPYVLDFASLLSYLRHQGLLVWDQDCDFGILGLRTLQDEENMVKKLTNDLFPELYPKYVPERNLLQFYVEESREGVHADVWLWRLSQDESTVTVHDYASRSEDRPAHTMMPPLPATWLDSPTFVPNKAVEVATIEYGDTWNVAKVYRMDCMENLLHGRTF